MKKLMMMTVCMVAAVSAAQALGSGDGRDAALSGTASAQADADLIKVVARGVGANKTDALKDAYRDAIERAVGLYVDAETMVRNEDLVRNQILTHSNAYVERFEEVGTSTQGSGLVQVRIVAFVRRRQLAASLKKEGVANEIRLGGTLQDVHAQLTSDTKRVQDAAALLRGALDGINPMRTLVTPTVLQNSRIVTQAGKMLPGGLGEARVPSGKIALSYMISYRLDTARYRTAFLPRLTDVLGQISTQPTRKIRLSAAAGHWLNEDEEARFLSEGAGDNCYCIHRDTGWFRGIFYYDGILDGKECWFRPTELTQDFRRADNRTYTSWGFSYNGFFAGAPSRYEDKWAQGDVIVIDDWNERMTTAKATVYRLDAKATGVIALWLRDLGCGDHSHARPRDPEGCLPLAVSFIDAEGKEISSFNEWVPKCALQNVGSATFRQKEKGQRGDDAEWDDYLVSPFVGCAGQEFLKWHDFVMDEDELARIKSVKVEFAE